MTSSIGTLINNAYENTNVFNACMQVGIGASAFLTCSQLGVGMFGIMPLILSPSVVKHQPTNFQQNPKQFAQMWNFFFQKATKPVVGSVLISSLAFFIAAFNVPSVSTESTAKTFFSSSPSNTINNDVQLASRNFLFFTALVAISPLPFTAIRLLPNIQTLQNLLQKDVWTKADEQLAIRNVKLWNSGHKIRVTIYALSTLLGIFAYNAAPKS